jgi:uncharacterized protein (TIGR03118 family)
LTSPLAALSLSPAAADDSLEWFVPLLGGYPYALSGGESTLMNRPSLDPVRCALISLCTLATSHAAHAQYIQTNLVSDQAGMAAHTDPNLLNAWGIVFNPTGPVWVANNHSGTSTLYDGSGTPQSLIVNIPTPAASTGGAATGIVFNPTTNFNVTNGSQSAASKFIWATEDGTLAAWAPTVGASNPSTQSFITANRNVGAIYKGLTMVSPAAGTRLAVTDFHNNRVDVFNNDFSFNATASTAFVDPTIPAGYAPFNAKAINNKVYVTYAKQDATAEDDVPGAGFGYLSVFNPDGTFDHRIASQGALDAPWGLALAPANFGAYSNALLVGNFGDGHINAYNPTTNAFLGTLMGPNNQPLIIDGLWGLEFGNGVLNQATNTLYFAAGPGGEMHGLYGSIAVPSPSVAGALLAGALASLARRRRN